MAISLQLPPVLSHEVGSAVRNSIRAIMCNQFQANPHLLRQIMSRSGNCKIKELSYSLIRKIILNYLVVN